MQIQNKKIKGIKIPAGSGGEAWTNKSILTQYKRLFTNNKSLLQRARTFVVFKLLHRRD